MNELYAHALAVEREATQRFAELERYMREAGLHHIADEFESIGREEREQYEVLAIGTAGRELPKVSPWEYAAHFLGPEANVVRAPRNAREALALAIATERRTCGSAKCSSSPERSAGRAGRTPSAGRLYWWLVFVMCASSSARRRIR